MNNIRILYDGKSFVHNAHFSMFEDALTANGCSVEHIKLHSDFFVDCLHEDYNAVFINFFPAFFGKKDMLVVVYRLVRFLFTKKRHLKLVVYFHNKRPHGRTGFNHSPMLLYTKIMYRLADRVIVMNEDSKKYLEAYLSKRQINGKAFLIPLPNYIGVYSEALPSIPHNVHSEFEVAFFGLIRAYKNIELLIDAFREACKGRNMRLRIAGMLPEDQEDYGDELKARAQADGKISFSFGYIADNEMDARVRESDCVVLPYNQESVMNSGSVILAFSNARTVICPNISTLTDFDDSLYYGYSYANADEHKKMLTAKLIEAYEDWNADAERFYQKGDTLYDQVKENNSMEKTIERYGLLLKELFD